MIPRVEAHLIEDPTIERQVQGVIQSLVKRLRLAGTLQNWTGWTARDLACALAGRSTDRLAEENLGPTTAAGIIVDGLLGSHHPDSTELWGSPLGRALAFWGTGEPAAISRSSAAAALGCGRANILLMIRQGRLSEAEGKVFPARITTASLAHAMRLKYPLGAHDGRA